MSQMDILVLVQEFYAIEAITAMLSSENGVSFEPMRHSHNRWYRDFCDFRNEYTSKFAYAIFDYTALVVAAELRHCTDKASQHMEWFYSTGLSRDEVYIDCAVYNPHDILEAGLRLFDTIRVRWSRGYGGEKWKRIAKAGLMRGTVSDPIFIDHCVDLSHNCSIYFDKGAGIFHLRCLGTYHMFLDMKRDCEPQSLIAAKQGPRFNQLLLRANNLGIIKPQPMDKLLPFVITEDEALLLDYCPVNWGDKRLDYSESNITVHAFFYDENARRERYDERDYKRCA